MNLLHRAPPPDFVLYNVLRQVREDRGMTHIVYHYKRVREWANPTGEEAEKAYAWLRKGVRTELETDRLRVMHEGRPDVFGQKRTERQRNRTPLQIGLRAFFLRQWTLTQTLDHTTSRPRPAPPPC